MRFGLRNVIEGSRRREARGGGRDCRAFRGDWLFCRRGLRRQLLNLVLRIEIVDEGGADGLIQNIVSARVTRTLGLWILLLVE